MGVWGQSKKVVYKTGFNGADFSPYSLLALVMNLDRARGGWESQAGRGAAGVGLAAVTRVLAVDAEAGIARRWG